MNATRKMEPVMSASDPIPTPDEEVKMLTALGFIDLGYHPTVTCFELVDSIETPLCAITVIAEIHRAPGRKKYHLTLTSRVYYADRHELMVMRRVNKYVSSIAEAVQFFRFRPKSASSQPPGSC